MKIVCICDRENDGALATELAIGRTEIPILLAYPKTADELFELVKKLEVHVKEQLFRENSTVGEMIAGYLHRFRPLKPLCLIVIVPAKCDLSISDNMVDEAEWISRVSSAINNIRYVDMSFRVLCFREAQGLRDNSGDAISRFGWNVALLARDLRRSVAGPSKTNAAVILQAFESGVTVTLQLLKEDKRRGERERIATIIFGGLAVPAIAGFASGAAAHAMDKFPSVAWRAYDQMSRQYGDFLTNVYVIILLFIAYLLIRFLLFKIHDLAILLSSHSRMN